MLLRTPIKRLTTALSIPIILTSRILKTYAPSTEHFSSSLTRRIAYGAVNVPISSKFHQVQLPVKVNQILALLVKEKSFNEKVVLLEHLTDIITDDVRIILTRDQQSIINRQLSLWKGRKGRFEKVATVAWVIKKLNLFKKHKDLYNEIAERMSNDQWYVNFDQSLKALEAFTCLQDEELKDYIYPRIERNIDITVWQFNMTVYQRITMGLLEGQRLESKLWGKLQDHILKNLGMQYSLKTITDIFTCYALARQGSDIFFQQLQKVIYLGHWHDYEFKHKILPGYDQTGQFMALLVQTYSIVKQNCDITLLPDFMDYIYKGVTSRTTNYQKLQSFTRVVRFLPGIFNQDDQEDVLHNLLENKKPLSFTYDEVIQFYDTMAQKGRKIPLVLHTHIQKVLISDINKKLYPPSKVLQICEELLSKDYVLNPEQLFDAIQSVVVSGYRYLQAEQSKAVKQLSSKSLFLPSRTKQYLSLPYIPSK